MVLNWQQVGAFKSEIELEEYLSLENIHISKINVINYTGKCKCVRDTNDYIVSICRISIRYLFCRCTHGCKMRYKTKICKNMALLEVLRDKHYHDIDKICQISTMEKAAQIASSKFDYKSDKDHMNYTMQNINKNDISSTFISKIEQNELKKFNFKSDHMYYTMKNFEANDLSKSLNSVIIIKTLFESVLVIIVSFFCFGILFLTYF
jgi:hypothetical protein